MSQLVTPTGTKIQVGGAVWNGQFELNGQVKSASFYTSTLSQSEIQSIYNNGINYSEIGNTNLAHYWVMDNETTVKDLVGSNDLTVTGATLVTNARQSDSKSTNHGATIGATTTTSVYGGNAPILPRAVDVAKEGQADAIGNGSALFNGSSDFVQVDNITLPNLEPYTITSWINVSDVDQAQAIVLWGDQATNERRAIIIYNGGNGSDWTLVASTNGQNPQGATTVTEGEWTHASITVNPSTRAYKIYMNGILDGSGTYSSDLVAFSNSTLFIGKSYYGEFFEGNISQVGIWYGELTQAQIQSVMESTSYSKIPADVKSTLGSEKVGDSSFDDASYWSITQGTGTLDVNTTNTGKLTAINAQDKRIAKASILESGKLYKITVVVDSFTNGRINVHFENVKIFFTEGAGTYSAYFVAGF